MSAPHDNQHDSQHSIPRSINGWAVLALLFFSAMVIGLGQGISNTQLVVVSMVALLVALVGVRG